MPGKGGELHQQLKWLICGLCRLDNLPKHLGVEMPDQPLPMGQVKVSLGANPDSLRDGPVQGHDDRSWHKKLLKNYRLNNLIFLFFLQDIEDLDHYEMKEEPMSGKQLEDEGTEKENWAILEKIRKTERYVLDGGALCMEPLTKQLIIFL
ncbi:ubiquitin-conjugating enzyme E2 Q2-like [Macaca nemestrina]|uniref:ubiquitin-conjugating enzyme E2 Q2-like n=1 Tax=Macaca nemestrina TaxID=9545 RepID=UPI0039B981E7